MPSRTSATLIKLDLWKSCVKNIKCAVLIGQKNVLLFYRLVSTRDGCREDSSWWTFILNTIVRNGWLKSAKRSISSNWDKLLIYLFFQRRSFNICYTLNLSLVVIMQLSARGYFQDYKNLFIVTLLLNLIFFHILYSLFHGFFKSL